MRAFLKATALLGPALTSAISLPFAGPARDDLVNGAGSRYPDEVLVRLTTSVPGLFVGVDDGVEFSLTVPSTHAECKPWSQGPLLNGVSLQQHWSRDVGVRTASGRQQVSAQLSNGLGERQVVVDWNAQCIRNKGQVLSVKVHEVLGHGPLAPQAVGFAVGFEQQGQPIIHRLENTPIPSMPLPQDDVDLWLRPSKDQRLPVGPNGFPASPLDIEFGNLEDIKAQLASVHKLMRLQERKILHMLKQDFKQCEDMKCIVQTAMQKAPDFGHLIAEHFRHTRLERGHFDEVAFVESTSLPSGPPPPADMDEHHPSPPGIDGNHSLPPSPPPGLRWNPPILHLIHYHRFRILKAALAFAAFSFLTSLLFRCIRQQIRCCTNPRRAADRAARREERNTRRAYRCAARHHQLSTWWARHRPTRSNGDYDEKRAMILQQEGVLEDAMQAEIRNLRTAHELVGEMVRAEEGRARLYHAANALQSPQELDGETGSSNRTGFAVPPPRYEEELDEDMAIVDGFQYTPSNTDETPESSVVDCSPRLSIDTGRTTLTKDTGD